jgi:pilus assembly protein Flp/PilA
MKKFLARLRRNDEGASLVEYGLLVALIAVVCIASVTLLGTTIMAQFTSITSGL